MSVSPAFRLALTLLLLPAAAAAAPGESATGFVEVPGGKLWYEAKGEGTPMVLLHDGLLPSSTWDGQFDVFAQRFRVIRYDRRGFGRSEPPAGSFSDVEDLHSVFVSLKIDRAIVVGCSNGARISVDYALAHPERVETLVLVGPVVSGLGYSEHFLRRGIANYRPFYQEQSLDKLIDNWVRDPYLTDAGNASAKERLRELLNANRGPLQRSPVGRPPDRPAAGRLGEITLPTLILVGAADIPDVHAHAGALEAGIRGARRVILPGTGHLIQLEQPEVFNREVLDFLRPAEAAREYLRSLPALDFEKAGHLFDYDAKAPLDVQEKGTEQRGDVRIVDLSYASPKGGRVPAYLILPAGEGRHPAVLFLHPGQGDRSTFVNEAVELAGKGIVSLTFSAPFLRPEFQEARKGKPFFDPETERGGQIQTILDVRRGFDLLVSRPEVDPKRLVYVGHSLGATVAGPLVAIDRRPIAHVLMAGYPSLTHATTDGHDGTAIFFQEILTPERQTAYLSAMAPLDSVYYIGRAAPAKLLFQFARRDEYITPFDAELYIAAASEPKDVRWYATDHSFNEQARRDRVEWVLRVLGIP